MTKLEILLVILVIAIILLYPWMIWHLMHQTELIGTLKWGFLLVAVSSGAVKSSSK